MAAKRRNLLSLLGRSSLGSAILMTLFAVCVASALPLNVQASSSKAVKPATTSPAQGTHDTSLTAP
jgi:hypothetical protein